VKKDDYDEAMRLAAQANPTWKKNPPGVKQNERDSLGDKLKGKLGAESHKMKHNGKW